MAPADPPRKSLDMQIIDAWISRVIDAQKAEIAGPQPDEGWDATYAWLLRRAESSVQPTWLRRAKQLHDQLGKFIYAMAKEWSPEPFSRDVVHEAERQLRLIVDSWPGETSQSRLDAVTFLAVIDMVSRRDPSVAPSLEAGQSPAEVVCFAYSLHDYMAAVRLAWHVDDIAQILERWPDKTPRRPTKWQLLEALWPKATGTKLSAETWRRSDPRKKQVMPGDRPRVRKPK